MEIDNHTDLREKKLDSYVAEVKGKLERQGVDIPDHCDQFIVRCLRVKNHDTDKAAQLVRNFGIMMKMRVMRDIYEKFKPSDLKGLYFNGTIIPLLKRDSLGRLVVFAQASSWNPKEFDFDQALAAFIVLFNYSIAQSKQIQCSGVIFVLNLSGWNFDQIRSVKLGRLQMVTKLMQNCCPGKIKGIHLINHPKVVTVLFTLVKAFLKTKLASRIYFHANEESLDNVFGGAQFLSETMTGIKTWSGSIIDTQLLNDLIQKDEYCQEMVKHGYPSF